MLMLTLGAAESEAFSFNPFPYIYGLLTSLRSKKETYILINPQENPNGQADFFSHDDTFSSHYSFSTPRGDFTGFVITTAQKNVYNNRLNAINWKTDSTNPDVVFITDQQKIDTGKTMAQLIGNNLPNDMLSELHSWRAYLPFTSMDGHVKRAAIKNVSQAKDDMEKIFNKLKVQSIYSSTGAKLPEVCTAGLMFTHKDKLICAIIYLRAKNLLKEPNFFNTDGNNNNLSLDPLVKKIDDEYEMKILSLPQKSTPRIIIHNFQSSKFEPAMQQNSIADTIEAYATKYYNRQMSERTVGLSSILSDEFKKSYADQYFVFATQLIKKPTNSLK
jgi:hypothetical protein